MQADAPWMNARGHIAWILALAASTILIINLERLERAFCTETPLDAQEISILP